jgi:hypothetical protein
VIVPDHLTQETLSSTYTFWNEWPREHHIEEEFFSHKTFHEKACGNAILTLAIFAKAPFGFHYSVCVYFFYLNLVLYAKPVKSLFFLLHIVLKVGLFLLVQCIYLSLKVSSLFENE